MKKNWNTKLPLFLGTKSRNALWLAFLNICHEENLSSMGSTGNQVDFIILVNDGDKYPTCPGVDCTALIRRIEILIIKRCASA